MSNSFYNASGYPATRAQGASLNARNEFAGVASGFDKLPTLAGNSLKLLRVNAAATGLEAYDHAFAPAVGGSYLPLTGGTLTGNLTATGSATATPYAESSYAGFTVTNAAGVRRLEITYAGTGTGGAYGAAPGGIAINAQGDLVLSTNDTERMRIAANGKVGIGTNNPGQLLHINAAGATPALVQWQRNGTIHGCMGDSTSLFTTYGTNILGIRGENGIEFGVADTRNMSLESRGFVGLNGTYAAALSGLGASTAPFDGGTVYVPNSDTPSYTPVIRNNTYLTGAGYQAHLSIGQYRQQANGWGGGVYFAFGGNDSYPTTAWHLDRAGLIYRPGGGSLGITTDNGLYSGRLYAGWDSGAAGGISCNNWFRTTGETGIHFSSYGVGVGPDTSTYGSVKAYYTRSLYSGFCLYNGVKFMGASSNWGIYNGVDGSWLMHSPDITSGSVHFKGNVVAYSTSMSDRRLKKDIEPIRGALDKLMQITGVTYKMIADDKPGVGVIAQDVQAVFPDLVHATTKVKQPDDKGPDEELLTVAYGQLIGPVIEALREINDRLKKLEER